MTPAPVVLIFAHPYPDRSIANRTLLKAVDHLAGIDVRSLYDLYPTFDIDVSAEQAALSKADVVVLQHPMYWYSVPSLLKHWFDKVLARGFAYGHEGKALWGKRCLWVVTTGGDEQAFGRHGMHRRPFREFAPVVEQTALFCGMIWEEPLVVYGAHRLQPEELAVAAREYGKRLERLTAHVGSARGVPLPGERVPELRERDQEPPSEGQKRTDEHPEPAPERARSGAGKQGAP
jgi:glutathione-regulated potassium-efflux system ancillary protein KefF